MESLTIAEKTLIQLWHLQERLPWSCPHRSGRNHGHCRRALVLSAGPVGLLGVMALRAHDFETIVYSRETPPHPRPALVESIGASYLSSERVTPDRIAEECGSIDLVYEASGASALSFEVMQLLGANSVFIFAGVPRRKAPVAVDTDLWMRNLVLRNQIVFGTVNAGRDAFEHAIRDLEGFDRRWPEPTAQLISGRHPLEKGPELILGRPGGIKHVLSIGEAL